MIGTLAFDITATDVVIRAARIAPASLDNSSFLFLSVSLLVDTTRSMSLSSILDSVAESLPCRGSPAWQVQLRLPRSERSDARVGPELVHSPHYKLNGEQADLVFLASGRHMTIPRIDLLVEPCVSSSITAILFPSSHLCSVVTVVPVHVPHPRTSPLRRFTLLFEVAGSGVGDPPALLRSCGRRGRS